MKVTRNPPLKDKEGRRHRFTHS